MYDNKEYTYEEVLEIFNFYKTHSVNDTLKEFNIGPGKFSIVLKKFGLKKSADDIKLTKKLAMKKAKENDPDIWVKRNLKTAKTLQERTGDPSITNVFQLATTKDKIISSRLENNPGKTIEELYSESAIKASDTKELLYGYRGVNQEKSKITKLERYNDENYNNPTKNIETKIQHFGSWENYYNYWLESVIESNYSKYGTSWWQQTDSWKNDLTVVFNNKYGVDRYSQLPIWASEVKKLYKYDGIAFDSLWELQYYIYCKETGKNIMRSDKSFEYIFENKKRIYHPDFEVDNKLIEIKGDHFFKEDGTMCNPFDHSQDKLYEAKHQCGLNNGVIFLTGKDLVDCFIWCRDNNFDINDYIMEG